MKVGKWFENNQKWVLSFFICMSVVFGGLSLYQHYIQSENTIYGEIPKAMLGFWDGCDFVEGEVVNYSTAGNIDPIYNLSISTVTIIDKKGYERPLKMIFDMEPSRVGNYQSLGHNAVIWGDYVQFVGEWYQLQENGGQRNIFRCYYYRQIYEWV